MRTIYFEKNIPKFLLTKALRRLWSNVIYSPLSPTCFVDLPEEALPGPNFVRVRNRLCGICASDLHLLFVEADPMTSLAALPGSNRRYLGHEVLSEVVEVGAAVETLKVGDRVIMDTRFQGSNCLTQEIDPRCHHCREGNYALCDNASLGRALPGVGGGWGDGYTAHKTEVYRVLDDFSDEQAMMIEPLSVGVRTVLRALPKPGQHALVVGSGIIGLTVIQALRALSPQCHITAMARYPQQIELARKLGADEIIARDDPYAATARITGGKLYSGPFNNRMILGGFDVVYDCIGSQKTLQDSLRWTRAGGTVVLSGVSLELMKIDLTPIWAQEVNLVGLLAHGMEEWNGVRLRTYDLTSQLLLAGKLTIDGLITHSFPLERWREAIATSLDKRNGAVKVVFDYRENATSA
jgi:threonine dehydrogenase-like Zn-dependent dehydrogenase